MIFYVITLFWIFVVTYYTPLIRTRLVHPNVFHHSPASAPRYDQEACELLVLLKPIEVLWGYVHTIQYKRFCTSKHWLCPLMTLLELSQTVTDPISQIMACGGLVIRRQLHPCVNAEDFSLCYQLLFGLKTCFRA